jgi:hypothetical protein
LSIDIRYTLVEVRQPPGSVARTLKSVGEDRCPPVGGWKSGAVPQL